MACHPQAESFGVPIDIDLSAIEDQLGGPSIRKGWILLNPGVSKNCCVLEEMTFVISNLYLHFLQSYIQLEVFLSGIDPIDRFQVSELWKKIRFELNWHESNHARLQGFYCCSPRNSIDQIASLATQGFVTLAKVFSRSGRGWENPPQRVSNISDSRVFVSFTFSGIIVKLYTPQNKHGTWKWTLGKGDSYWKPSFPGSMLIFGGVVGVVFFSTFYTWSWWVKVPAAIGKRNANLPSLGVGDPIFLDVEPWQFLFWERLMDFFLGWEVTVCQVYGGLGVEVSSVFFGCQYCLTRHIETFTKSGKVRTLGGQQLVIGRLQGVPPPPSPLGPASDLNTMARMQETCNFSNFLTSESDFVHHWPMTHRPSLISLWTQEMEQENAQLRERYSQMQMQAVWICAVITNEFFQAFLGIKSLQVSELTNERSQLTEQLDQALVEVSRSFLNRNCDGKKKTFKYVHVGFCMYLCLYVWICHMYMSYSHMCWSSGLVFRKIWSRLSS